MFGPGLFHGLVRPSRSAFVDNTCSLSGVNVVSDSLDSLEKPTKMQLLIPPQVLVQLSTKARPPEQLAEERRREECRFGRGGGESSRLRTTVVAWWKSE